MLTLLVAASSAAQALTVAKVVLTGNQSVPKSTFALATRPGLPVSDSLLALDRSAILKVYSGLGFFQAGVDIEQQPVADRVEIRFRISEGQRMRIGNVGLAGNHLISTVRLRSVLPVRSGFFATSGIQQNAGALLTFYGDNGFPFCRVSPESLVLGDSLVSYVLAIDEGPEVRLSDVAFSGTYETSPSLLKRMLGFRLNVPYSEAEARQRIDRFAADPLLTISGYDVRKGERGFILNVAVKEQKSNIIAGSVAYSAEYKELVGSANLNLANLFGTRRAVAVTWQGSKGRQDLDFSYTEPWLLGTGIRAVVAAHNRLRDTSFSATDISVAGTFRVADPLELEFGTGYELVASGLKDLPSSRTWWVSSGLGLETRDHPANPSKGSRGVLMTRFGSRRLDQGQTGVLIRGAIDAGQVVPLRDRLNLTFGGHGRLVLSSDTIYDYDVYELGGANTVRGYREGAFRPDRAAWLTSELRYLAGRGSRVYPFFDIVWLRENGVYAWHSATGVGLRVESRLGVVGVDYGIPIQAGSGPLRGKVHFSLQTSF